MKIATSRRRPWLPRIPRTLVQEMKEGGRWAKISAIANFILAVVALLALAITCDQNQKSQKLFIGANTPLIDVSPVAIALTKGEGGFYYATTGLSIANYSGFEASDVGIDLKYGEKAFWISEWLKAEEERKTKQGEDISLGKTYLSSPNVKVPKLEPGMRAMITLTGTFDPEYYEVCVKGGSVAVMVRATWKNAEGHTFDEIHKYSLLSTRSVKEGKTGYAFTFVPEGVISRKDAKSGVQ